MLVRLSPRPNRADRVRWRPWGTEAFEEAAHSNKLIALFVVAFWCGVCQRLDETVLSNDDVGLLLNAYFVPIRVDESERPDVDLRYNQNGWPTIVFLTPDGRSLGAINAVEPEAFITLLTKLVDAHERDPAGLAAQAAPATQSLAQPVADPAQLTSAKVDEIVQQLMDLADPVHGGFGGPHKYLVPEANALLLYLAEHHGDARCLDHVLLTLRTLPERAIFDPTDGGFFRYSSQPDWNEPHREKLLGDQAALLRNYLDAYRLTGDAGFRHTAEALLGYLERTLTLDRGPFFCGCQDVVDHATALLDRNIYCDANAQAASALWHAWRSLGLAACRARAEALVDALWHRFKAPHGGLYHYAAAAANDHAYAGADDYAYVAADDQAPQVPGLLQDSVAMGLALLDGYRAVGHPRYLERATELAGEILRLHLNPSGGFFDISRAGPAALQRPVTPVGHNAAAAHFFLDLADLTSAPHLRDAARWALLTTPTPLRPYGPFAAPHAHALSRLLAPQPPFSR